MITANMNEHSIFFNLPGLDRNAYTERDEGLFEKNKDLSWTVQNAKENQSIYIVIKFVNLYIGLCLSIILARK